MAAPVYNIFAGSEIGILKGIDTEKEVWKNLISPTTVSKNEEINVMCWADEERTKICCGHRNQTVTTYDASNGELSETQSCVAGTGTFRGLSVYENSLLSCVDSGHLNLWKNAESQLEIDAGENIFKMRHNIEDPRLVATGGKENPLKIWDLENHSKPIFQTKNVRPDWLCLRVPIWVMDIQFMPNSQKIVTCTGHHQIRVYDPGASQKRPVFEMEFDEYPLTAMSLRPDYNQLVVGNTHGNMALIDLRNKGQIVQKYKGFAGAVRGLECHPSLPLVTSCSLDRFARIHNIDTKELIHKFYLKSRLNCLLTKAEWSDVTTTKSVPKKNISEIAAPADDISLKDEPDIWDMMDVVKTRKSKRNIIKDGSLQKKIGNTKIPGEHRKRRKHLE